MPFMHLHVVKVRYTKKVIKINKKRRKSSLLNKCFNICMFFEISYLRRWSNIFEKLRLDLVR